MVIEYTPHAAQMEIHRARGFRFRTVCTGRRLGKTLCMAAESLDRGGVGALAQPRSRARGVLHLGRRRPGAGPGVNRQAEDQRRRAESRQNGSAWFADPFLCSSWNPDHTSGRAFYRVSTVWFVVLIVWFSGARFPACFRVQGQDRRNEGLKTKNPGVTGVSPQEPG